MNLVRFCKKMFRKRFSSVVQGIEVCFLQRTLVRQLRINIINNNNYNYYYFLNIINVYQYNTGGTTCKSVLGLFCSLSNHVL